jgi:hypothetical protein
MGKLMMVVVVLVGCGPVDPGGDAGLSDEADGDVWTAPYAECVEGVPVCPEGWTPACGHWTLVEDRCHIFATVTCEWDGAATCNGGRTPGTCIGPVILPDSSGFDIRCGG